MRQLKTKVIGMPRKIDRDMRRGRAVKTYKKKRKQTSRCIGVTSKNAVSLFEPLPSKIRAMPIEKKIIEKNRKSCIYFTFILSIWPNLMVRN